MPSLTVTIEDNSPIISYSTGWRAGHSSDDKLANMYSQSSFTVTNVAGASASFSFNGTMIEIYGAKRGNHGLFQVKLDDVLYPPRTGSAPDPGVFQEPIFSVDDLALGLHTVTLTNQEDKFLDIDFVSITWDTIIGVNATGKLFTETYQDTSSSFTYLPSEGDWGANPKRLGSFSGGTGHATTQPGEGISLYGPIGPGGSPYSVQIDGLPMSIFTAKKEFFTPQTLLYHASSLGPGLHNLTLTFQPDAPQQMFAIDYATIFTETGLSNGKDTVSNPTVSNTTQVEKIGIHQMKRYAGFTGPEVF
ncbi:hypothetical protein BDZ94DRAFT_1309760 [Collybia nuda]|uniref:Uncharacterized protein n=1 Tax=Collybia nuda TaxID=64659 RepID=A0A9P5Y2L7_9AGAR|nr:hypothetical protein BDZ94DRAFT_1309760 [Collybia nuda]